MMGPKTLSVIKEELRAALRKTGKDPIEWLENRIRLLETAKKPDHGEIELLRGLTHVLSQTNKRKSGRRRPTKAAR